jgi:cyclopropane-fatty-acyl-phospholipid synthase
MSAISTIACAEADAERPCVRASIARRISARIMRRIPVRVALADGTTLGSRAVLGPDAPADAPEIRVERPRAFFSRLGHEPLIGFGDSYMAGDWRPGPGTDLGAALTEFAERITTAIPGWVQRVSTLVSARKPRAQRNTIQGSRRNIEAHYDLSNDLFAAFLDPSLTYSSALFDESRPWEDQTLEEAQIRKVDSALDLAEVRDGMHILEIGTGWGTLAIRAAKRGAQVTTLTLSQEQAALAAERARVAGVADRIDIRLQDYREATGTYDAVVSVEMIEAVGEEYWQTYFATIDRLLAPGGTAVVQSILMRHDRYLATRRSHSWIQKHIFPGGIIPSVKAIRHHTAKTTLVITEQKHFGLHYAETLRRWRATFNERWPHIEALGFDDRFRRMWELYLAYSESGFATDYLDVAQIRLERAAA